MHPILYFFCCDATSLSYILWRICNLHFSNILEKKGTFVLWIFSRYIVQFLFPFFHVMLDFQTETHSKMLFFFVFWPQMFWTTDEPPGAIRGPGSEGTSELISANSRHLAHSVRLCVKGWIRKLCREREVGVFVCLFGTIQIIVSYLPRELWFYLDWPFPPQVTGCGSVGERGGGSTIRPDQNRRVWCSLYRCHTHQTVRCPHQVRRSSRTLRDWRWRVTQSLTPFLLCPSDLWACLPPTLCVCVCACMCLRVCAGE